MIFSLVRAPPPPLINSFKLLNSSQLSIYKSTSTEFKSTTLKLCERSLAFVASDAGTIQSISKLSFAFANSSEFF